MDIDVTKQLICLSISGWKSRDREKILDIRDPAYVVIRL